MKKLGLRTRGNPWAEFDRRVKRNIGVLKRKGIVEEYKSKNMRLKLIPTNDQLSLFKGQQKKRAKKGIKS